MLHLALVAPEAREAHGGAEFPGFGLLLTSNGEGELEIVFSRQRIGFRLARDFPSDAIHVRFPPGFVAIFDCSYRLVNIAPRFVELAEFSVGFSQIRSIPRRPP